MDQNRGDGANPFEVKKLEGSMYGYDEVEIGPGGEVLYLKNSKNDMPEIRVGRKMTVVGDSHGYAGGLTNGQTVEITMIQMPRSGQTDVIGVKVVDTGEVSLLKPKELK